MTMAEGRRRSGAARGPPSPSPSPRRAVSVCESLDLQGVPAVRAALGAAQQQRRRPKSFCAPGGGPGVGALLGSAPRPRGGLLDFFRPRRREEGDGGGAPVAGGAQRARPGSVTFLPAARPLPADSPGFPRGGSLWGSRRWNLFGRGSPGPRRHLSALRKSFSFRLRRGHELRRSESGGLRPARLRTKSEGDAASLHACPSKRDLLYPELGRAGLRAEPGPPGGLWKLLTSRFRRRERGAGPKETRGGNDPVLLGGGPLRALGECGGRRVGSGAVRHRGAAAVTASASVPGGTFRGAPVRGGRGRRLGAGGAGGGKPRAGLSGRRRELKGVPLAGGGALVPAGAGGRESRGALRGVLHSSVWARGALWGAVGAAGRAGACSGARARGGLSSRCRAGALQAVLPRAALPVLGLPGLAVELRCLHPSPVSFPGPISRCRSPFRSPARPHGSGRGAGRSARRPWAF